MKCLTVKQPWADAIIKGIPVPGGIEHKPVENRSKAYKHRGKTLIHAGKSFDYAGWEWIQETFGVVLPDPESYQTGGFIGEVTITDCVTDSPSRWAEPGQNHLLLADPVELPFFPAKGQLGFWNEPACRVCGCTTYNPCDGGCYWIEPDLCSKCKEQCQTCKWSKSEHCKDCFCNEFYEEPEHNYRICNQPDCEECQQLVEAGLIVACDGCDLPMDSDGDYLLMDDGRTLCQSCFEQEEKERGEK